MAPIYQLSQEDVDRSSTLDPSDVGKWVWIMSGCICGFTDTREEAVDMLIHGLPYSVIVHPVPERFSK
jgi:hypothetical protein